MAGIDDLKEAANPFNKLAKETLEHSEKTDTVITLLGSICDVIDANLLVNQDILEEKKANHAAWIKATNRRFYISLLAVLATGAVLYLDVLQINENSEIIGSVIDVVKAVSGLLL